MLLVVLIKSTKMTRKKIRRRDDRDKGDGITEDANDGLLMMMKSMDKKRTTAN